MCVCELKTYSRMECSGCVGQSLSRCPIFPRAGGGGRYGRTVLALYVNRPSGRLDLTPFSEEFVKL